jgi:Cu-processing system ATP-binding protein
MLSIENLNKSYGHIQVLNDLNLSFNIGEVVGIMGPNGSGKTTLIKCILGLTQANSGHISYNQISQNNQNEYKKAFGYMPQIGRYPENMKIMELFELIKSMREKELNNLDEELWFEFKLDEMKDKKLASLSGGTTQKVSAALAYLFKPSVIILDEPTAGLDPLATEILKNKISREANEKITLITSHILSDLEELTTHILYLNKQSILLHSPVEPLRNKDGQLHLNKVIAELLKD